MQEDVLATFRSLRSEARTNSQNEWYPEAIEWYEKAFDFGLQFKDRIEPTEVQEAAFKTWELTNDLSPGDRNYCRCIHVARKFIKHFNKNETDCWRGSYIAWLVVRDYKPIAGKLSFEDQKALYLLEHEGKRHPCVFNKNDYLRN